MKHTTSDAKNKPGSSPGRAWREHADDLAGWAFARLVNRIDVWGAYTRLAVRGQHYVRADGSQARVGASYTRPAPDQRGQVVLSHDTLARHFRGRGPEDVVGLHSTSFENTSRWGALDIDCHDGGRADPGRNLAAAVAWYDRLRDLGFAPLLTSSNDRGGYHLRVLFSEPVWTPLVFGFLRWLRADHAAYGLHSPPETFPKQRLLGKGNCYGNWLRVPGRHHTREHWSTVWDGVRWQEGERAIAFLLGLAGTPPDLIPPEAEACPAPVAAGPMVKKKPCSFGPPTPAPPLARRISSYLAKLPHGLGEGQGRDDVAYHFAAFLVRDLALADEEALRWLRRWDDGNRPPKGDARLREIIESAHRYGKNAYGSGAGPGRRYGARQIIHFGFTVGD